MVHKAYPYSDRATATRRVRVRPQTSALSRDHRRPLTRSSPSMWPPCSEAFHGLPPGPPSPRRFGNPPTGAAAWQFKAVRPVWGHETRPNVNEALLTLRGTGPPLRQRKVLAPEVNEREIEADPFVKFFVQRPLARHEFASRTLPSLRRHIEVEHARQAEQLRKDETTAINETASYLQRIGMLAMRRPEAVRVRRAVHTPVFSEEP